MMQQMAATGNSPRRSPLNTKLAINAQSTLRESCTHQHIAQVDHQAHGDYFGVCGLNSHQRISAIFSS